MPLINNLYVQSLTQELPAQDLPGTPAFDAKVDELARLIAAADAVVVGIGSGMSTSAGLDFYHRSDDFDAHFAQFEASCGFDTLFDGLYHVFSGREEQWAFHAAVARYVRSLPVAQPYQRLADLLASKDHFVVTSNVDGQAPRSFSPERTFLFQGDLRFWQCFQPCTDEVWDNAQLANELVANTRIGADGVPRIPEDLLPRCPHCGWLMAPWVRDTNFAEGALWHEQEDRYRAFLTRHLVDAADRVLFLELGVSSMTPAVIKFPFWSMAAKNPQTHYVCVNIGEKSTPLQLGTRATVVTADIAAVVDALLERDGRNAEEPGRD